MKFNAREDIDMPQEQAFRALSDFDHWERTALRKGANVQRKDTLAVPGPGMTWDIGFVWRAKARNLNVRLAEFDAPQAMRFEGVSPSFEGWMTVEVVRMGARRARLALTVEVRPRTLAARLFLQSARLARRRIKTRLDLRMKQLAAAVVGRPFRG